jgi:radical SAM protein with 4Fe4S-binding SPASM domain
MLPHFHTLYLESTRRCNLDCPYCSTDSNSARTSEGELSFNEILHSVFEPALEIGTKHITFSGGEFLIRKDAFKLLDIANQMGFRISVVSNGTTLNMKVLNKLQSLLGANIFISLGINSFEARNKETRNKDINFTLKKIKMIQSLGIRINISVTMGMFNSEDFGDTLEHIRKMGLPFNRIPFVIRGRNAPHLIPDKETMKNKFHAALRETFHGCVSYTPFFLDPKTYFETSGQSEEANSVPTNPSIGCWCGSFYAINSEGDVSVCPLLLDHVSGGNVLDQNLESILNKSELFQKVVNRENLEGNCGKCKYRFTCGGCRALAFYKNGNTFGEDPTCFLDDLSPQELSVIEAETQKSFKNYTRMATIANSYYCPF